MLPSRPLRVSLSCVTRIGSPPTTTPVQSSTGVSIDQSSEVPVPSSSLIPPSRTSQSFVRPLLPATVQPGYMSPTVTVTSMVSVSSPSLAVTVTMRLLIASWFSAIVVVIWPLVSPIAKYMASSPPMAVGQRVVVGSRSP